MSENKYKSGRVQVKLIGEDGNIYVLTHICVQKMKQIGMSDNQIMQFQKEVFSAESYDHALFVIQTWFDVV